MELRAERFATYIRVVAARAYAESVETVRKHFFISYNSADEKWAQWIAQVLEDADYSVIIQAWDFRPGSNFVLEMQQALQQTERMIAVLSPDYLKARFPQPEWAAAFAGDPEGARRALIPVMVRECEPDGLLSQVVQIRIHNIQDPDAAARAILDGVMPGRAKPSARLPFPGLPTDRSVSTSPTSASGRLRWLRVDTPATVSWRTDLDHGVPNQQRAEAVELHLLPIGDDARLQVRELAELRDTLTDFGRQQRVFSSAEGLDARADASKASVVSTRREAASGLAVTRSGQRSTWAALPRGPLSAILDEDHLAGQIQAMLRTLAAMPVPNADLVIPVVAIEPAMMITIGKADAPPSNIATFGIHMPQYIRPAYDEALSFSELAVHASAIGAELAARLKIEHKVAAGMH